MKIALITLEGGGVSSVCYGLANSLKKKNISTTVFTETSKNHEIEVVNDLFNNRSSVHRFELPPRFFWFQLQNLRYLLR